MELISRMALVLLLAAGWVRGVEPAEPQSADAAPPTDQAVEVDFQLTLISEPASLSPEALAQKLADYRAKLPPDRPLPDEAVAEYRRTLTERIEDKSDEHLVMAPDFTAIRADSPRGVAFWDIRRGAECLMIYSNDQISITSDPEGKVQRSGDMARAVLEMSAKRAYRWVNSHTGGDSSVSVSSDQTTVKRGAKTVVFAAGRKQLISTEEAYGPGRTDRVEYADYRNFDGVAFPSKVTRTSTTPDGGRFRFIYEIKKVTVSGDPKVPTISEEVGLVQVFDQRFSPPLRYQAFRTLPDRQLVETWTKDPDALDKHNAEARFAASTAKPWWKK
ncbi:hypothetical protein BH09VER1_BH09VER1_45780 [soil metagenome]